MKTVQAMVVGVSCGSIAGYGYKAGQNRTVAIEESRGSEDGAGDGCGC